MRIELVTIGDELLLGYTIDTNGAFIARTLAADGVQVVRRTSCGDGADEIADAVRGALERTGAVITTGGLGPTADDLTKPSIAALFGRAMRKDDAILEALRERWKARGWPGGLPKANEQQAWIPEGATVLENRHGSAPGIWLENERGQWVAMLPGVPREMRGMLTDHLVPRLRVQGAAAVVRSATLRTTGISESMLADQLGALGKGFDGLSLAFLPGWEGVDLRLTARGRGAEDTDRALRDGVSRLREVAAIHAYGEGDADLAGVVIDLARTRGARIAVAESCTGGLLGARLTAGAGSSDVFLGGVLAYHNDVKTVELGVRAHTLETVGAVSEETAQEMARGVASKLGADIGIAITGIAGPGGGTAEKPVGTVCWAVSHGDAVVSRRAQLIGDRTEIRQRATQAALDLVRRTLAT
ncbi:MAG: competence/damage-inducible protein A [Gemmatimonadaceae bacterium]|nr:competence/damage-inducible protein A [Gemmatimonadaceae bacterium]